MAMTIKTGVNKTNLLYPCYQHFCLSFIVCHQELYSAKGVLLNRCLVNNDHKIVCVLCCCEKLWF